MIQNLSMSPDAFLLTLTPKGRSHRSVTNTPPTEDISEEQAEVSLTTKVQSLAHISCLINERLC